MSELVPMSTPIHLRPTRGRPKKKIGPDSPRPATKVIHKIMTAINNHSGQPIMYASTTKGTMKLIVDGHHFRYSFRKGKYTIFQCCYKENKEECVVRVVTDQKKVYPLDGEHVHFIQATDKSVTSVKFTPGEDIEQEQNVEAEQSTDEIQPLIIDETSPGFSDEVSQQEQPQQLGVKMENEGSIISQDQLEFTAETPVEIVNVAAASETEDANEFREKIKKRLQKALLGKKK